MSGRTEYNLILTNLNEIHRGLYLIDKNTYDQYIDLVCDNIHLEPVEDNQGCPCDGSEWKKQPQSNNHVFFVGFEPEKNFIGVDPTKCKQI